MKSLTIEIPDREYEIFKRVAKNFYEESPEEAALDMLRAGVAGDLEKTAGEFLGFGESVSYETWWKFDESENEEN